MPKSKHRKGFKQRKARKKRLAKLEKERLTSKLERGYRKQIEAAIADELRVRKESVKKVADADTVGVDLSPMSNVDIFAKED